MEQSCQWNSSTVNGTKAKGQLRLAINGIMAPFKCYGMNIYVQMAVDQLVEVSEKYHRRMQGEDVPIGVNGTYVPDTEAEAL